MPGIKWLSEGFTLKFWIKCKHASELSSRALDESLPLSARAALKLHHVVCANCARCAAQFKQMRGLLRTDFTYREGSGLSREAALRITTELQRKLNS